MSDFKKQHPVAAVSQVFETIKQNFITLIILFFIGTSNTDGYFLYFLAAGIGLSFIAGVFGWWVFRYRVNGDELQIKKGVFIKNNIYMSKDRIQVIDITEGLIQRIFGLVKVEIKTAGGGTESATISAISREDAESLRTELRKKNGQADLKSENEGNQLQDEEEKILDTWKLPNKDLVYAAFTSGNFGLIASILGAVSGQLNEVINEETIEYLYEVLPGFNNVTMIITVVVAIIVISWTLSFLGVIFNYSDFQIEKTSKELIITSGLIERKYITIPFDRIQAVRFVEGVIRQPFGYGMVYIESAGFNQTQKGRSIVIAPYLAADKFSEFLSNFLSEYEQPEYEIKPKPKVKFRYIRRPAYLILFLLPFVWLLLDYGWLMVFLLPLVGVLGWLRYRDAAIGIDEEFIRSRFRMISRTTAIAKRIRVQNVELSQNPFQSRKDVYSLSTTVASGAGGLNFEVEDLNAEDCQKVYDWVVKRKDQNVSQEYNHLKTNVSPEEDQE
jgi:putative membrane protein